LLVEDSTLLALELESGMVEAGAVVVGATGDLEEALSLAEADIDVAVLDVNLGGRLVTPVAQRLLDRRIPFVFATGYGELGAPKGFEAPIIRKPYSIQQIVRAVAEVVHFSSDDCPAAQV
jgi:CheY-like chemotaxis protein